MELILIVAECNVNRKKGVKMVKKEKILIVAECNVNPPKGGRLNYIFLF